MDNTKTTWNLKNIIASDKSRTVFVIIGLFAIVLIFFTSKTTKSGDTDSVKEFDTQGYQQTLTNEIKSMVESVEGAGRTKVMLTLENSYEYVYLDDDKTIRQVNEPTIRGVVVACEGGDDAVISARVTEILRTVLGIPSNKVCVSKLIL